MAILDRETPAPVTIIGGFLGAGKTTLVNHVLRSKAHRRIGVLVNDFGQISIDAGLIVGVEAGVISLANGCLCCSIKNDVVAALIRMIERSDPPEHILIETSGVSNPGAVVETFVDLQRRGVVRLDGVAVVVDGENFSTQGKAAGSLERCQLRAADLVILNKVDLISGARLAEVRAAISAEVPDARVLQAVRGAVPLEALLAMDADTKHPPRHEHARPVDQTHPAEHDHTHPAEHDHAPAPWVTTALGAANVGAANVGAANAGAANAGAANAGAANAGAANTPSAAGPAAAATGMTAPAHGLETWSFDAPSPFRWRALVDALKALPAGVLRIKGFVRLEERPGDKLVLHVVGRRIYVQTVGTWDARADRSKLVFIANADAIDAAKCSRDLSACLAGGAAGAAGGPGTAAAVDAPEAPGSPEAPQLPGPAGIVTARRG